MKKFAENIVNTDCFERVIIGLILLSALLLGLETYPELNQRYGDWFLMAQDVILALFIVEALLKIIALAPRPQDYFKSGWNIFDFSIIVLALIPAAGELAMIARIARLMRVLRLISVIPELRLIVNTLLRSIPSMGNIMILMSVIFYIYAIMGYHLFHQHDPEHWHSLGISLLTLFRIVTLEDWTDVMYTAMELSPYAWVYFVSFVVIGTFVVINLFIAVVLNNLEDAKLEQLRELSEELYTDDMLKELQAARDALSRLETRLQKEERPT